MSLGIIFYNFFKHGLFIFHDYAPIFQTGSVDQTIYVWAKNSNLGEFNPLIVSAIPMALLLKASFVFNNVFLGEIITYVLIFCFGLGSALLFFQYLFKKYAVSLLVSAYYVFNLFVVCRIYDGHIFLISIYLSLPLCLYLLSRYWDSHKYWNSSLIGVATLSLVFGGGLSNIPMSLGTLLIPSVLFLLIKYWLSENKATSLKKITILTIVSILTNLYWIIPTGYFYLSGFTGSLISESGSFGFNWPDVAGQRGGILGLLSGTSHWLWETGWAGDSWYYFSSLYRENVFFKVSLLVFPILAFYSLIVKHKSSTVRHIYLFSLVLLVLHLLLANGIQGPTGEIWKLFYSKIPLFNLFRAPPTKFGGPIFLSIGILAGMSLQELVFRKNIFKSIFIICLISILAISYPLVTGGVFYRDKVGFWDHRNLPYIPEDYLNVSKIINQNLYDSNIYEYPFALFGFFDFGYKKHEGVDLLNLLSSKSFISICSGFSTNCNILNLFQTDIESKLDKFASVNSRYILRHNDLFSYDDPGGYWKNNYVLGNILEPAYQSKLLDLFRVPDRYFLPHFYLENPKLVTAGNSASVEYKKISNVTYRVNLKNISDSSKLVFNESMDVGWKIYPAGEQKKNINSDFIYTSFRNNPDQANKEEIVQYIDQNAVSTLGDGAKKVKKYGAWIGYQYSVTDSQPYTVDFFSKKIHGTIQNDNLPGVSFWNTWLSDPIITESNYFKANDYANGWNLDPYSVCVKETSSCYKNPDGSFDIYLIVEFWPQRLFYFGLAISGLAVVSLVTLFFIEDIHSRRVS
mgnify:FL=1